MLRTRPLDADDQGRLWDWLHLALWDPPPAGHERVSLTVHPQNPAISLYECCGFVKTALRNSYHLMVAPL